MATLIESVEECFTAYKAFVNRLPGPILFVLAVVTAVAEVYVLSCTKIAIFVKYINLIIAAMAVYLVSIAVYIQHYRSQEPRASPAPIRFPFVWRTIKTGYYVGALTIFSIIDGPLKSVKNIYTPLFCVSAYFHIVVVLLILRRDQDYGISDGCLALAFGVLFSMAKANWQRIVIILATYILGNLRVLQIYTPPGLPTTSPSLSASPSPSASPSLPPDPNPASSSASPSLRPDPNPASSSTTIPEMKKHEKRAWNKYKNEFNKHRRDHSYP